MKTTPNIKNHTNERRGNKFFIPFLFLAISLIISALIITDTYRDVKLGELTVSVTGSATVDIKADEITWKISTDKLASRDTLSEDYAKLTTDVNYIKQFMLDGGIKESEISVASVETSTISNSSDGKELKLSQTITVKSGAVELVSKLSKKADSLIADGMYLAKNETELGYSKLEEVRIELSEKANDDARKRAEKMVEKTGQKIKEVKYASNNSVSLYENSAYMSTSVTYIVE